MGGDPSDPGPAPIAAFFVAVPLSGSPSLVGASLFSTNSKNFPLPLDCIQYTEYNVRHRNERK